MKRYLVFKGHHYYPSGGMKDFRRDFDNLAPAIAFAQGLLDGDAFAWTHIYDTVERKIVYEGEIE
jgi:hypothetical protein